MTSDFLSIITRSKNRPITLNRLREKLSIQTNKNYEWIIVNDCGDINSCTAVAEKALEQEINVRIVDNDMPRGRSYAANIGAKNATGDYIVIIDDDDYIADSYVDKVLSFLKTYTQFGAVSVWTRTVYEEITESTIRFIKKGRLYRPTCHDYFIVNMVADNQTPNCSIVVRKNLFFEAGGYPENIEYGEDWFFLVKLILIADIAAMHEVLAFYSKRLKTNGDIYKNSDVGANNIHSVSVYKWKNDLIREYITTGNGLGIIAIVSQIIYNQKHVSISGIIKSKIRQIFERFL